MAGKGKILAQWSVCGERGEGSGRMTQEQLWRRRGLWTGGVKLEMYGGLITSVLATRRVEWLCEVGDAWFDDNCVGNVVCRICVDASCYDEGCVANVACGVAV